VSDYLAFALIGLGVGSFYAALATGLVVTYRGTGIVNFAAGAMGTWAVYATDELRTAGDLVLPVVILPHRIDLGGPWPTTPAVLGGVLSAVGVGLAAHVGAFRPLRSAPALAKVIATVGVMVISQALIVANFGAEPRRVANLLPAQTVSIGALNVPIDRLIVASVAGALTALLWAYFRYTRLGLATLAGAESERAIASARFSPQWLAASAWALASASTALVLILASPFTVISPVIFTTAIVPALAAVMLARLSSLAVALVAGLGLGSINAMLTFSSIKPWWPDWARTGVTEAVQFIVLAAALYAFGRSLPQRGATATAPLPPVHLPTNRPSVIAALASLAVLAVVVTSGSYRFGVVTSMIIAIIALSLVVLTGFVGQISLAQAAFAGTSGFVLSKLLTATDIEFPLAPMLAALAATGVGLVVGLPALRIRGVHLAVVTLGLAVAVERFVFRNPVLSPGTGNPIEDPRLFGIDLGVREGRTIARIEFGLLVVAVLLVVFVAVGNLARSSTGRRFLAVRSDEQAAAAVGVDVAGTKLVAFALSSFLAGIGGVLLGYSRGQLSADSFTVFVGLSLLTFAYLGGITSLSGAVFAGVLAPLGIGFVVADRLVELGRWYLLASGVGLVLTAIFNPIGIAGANRAALTALRRRYTSSIEPIPAGQAAAPLLVEEPGAPATVATGAGPADPPAPISAAIPLIGLPGPAPASMRLDGSDRRGRATPGEAAPVVLEVVDLAVSYDGLRAVDGVSLQVRRQQIVGLIGANGAGKTTLVDAVGGFVHHEGEVRLAGVDLTDLPSHRRAAAGIGRTWQSIQLFDDLSVGDNLRVSVEPKSTWFALTELVRPRRRSMAGTDRRVVEVLEAMGLAGAAERRPEELSLGRQKLVGLGRAMVAEPTVVLLDEPAAGLDETARTRLAARIVDLVDDGSAALVIDHDMTFVFDVCDYLYVLDFGRIIAAGTPTEIRGDRNVVAAYLGASRRSPTLGARSSP